MTETSTVLMTPGLQSFLKLMKQRTVEANIQDLISLLKRRQIRSSRPCAIATARLLQRVVAANRISDGKTLIKRVTEVGRQLTAAQPREIAVGNVVRRVLGVIREEVGGDQKGRSTSARSETDTATDTISEPPETPVTAESKSRSRMSPLAQSMEIPAMHASLTPTATSVIMPNDPGFRPTLAGSQTSFATASQSMATSMFSLLSNPITGPSDSPLGSPRPGTGSPAPGAQRLTKVNVASLEGKDLRAEVLEGIEEIIDELNVVDDQIASYATEHIHSNEIILTQGASTTVQKFLLQAARKRRFTVIHAEAYPNNHRETHAIAIGKKAAESSGDEELDSESFTKPLIASGVTVVIIPDANIFALMSRVNKVILGTHVVLANGGLVAQAGAKAIAQAASIHRVPVVVLSGVYKLSPIYPFDFESLIEHGDPGAVLGYDDGELLEKVEVENALYDYVPPELVELYITNLGGHAPTYLYRIVADHYNTEDTDLVDMD